MEEKISVILVNYNGKDFNDKCIGSLLKSRLSALLEIVIVDNASTDGSFQELQEIWGEHPQIHLIGLDDNYGFSKANNTGILFAMERGIDHYLLLNNDTEVEPYTIENMLVCQRRTGSMIVPRIYYADRPDVIWCAGGEISRIIQKSKHRGIGRADRGQFEQDRLCSFANGCCLLLDREHVKAIGLLDESFFLYYEDNDYSLRAQDAGVSIRYCAGAVVYHKVNGATRGNEKPVNAYYITRNWMMCSRMHMKSLRFGLFCVYFGLNRMAWTVIWSLQRKPDMIKAMHRGIRDFCHGKTGKYQEREEA